MMLPYYFNVRYRLKCQATIDYQVKPKFLVVGDLLLVKTMCCPSQSPTTSHQ